jgi:hypothetical protein
MKNNKNIKFLNKTGKNQEKISFWFDKTYINTRKRSCKFLRLQTCYIINALGKHLANSESCPILRFL